MTKNESAVTPGSGHDVDDFSYLCEGDVEPSLNKIINTLVDSERGYIVYLDDEYSVEWTMNESYEGLPDGFGDVANRLGVLEALSMTQLRPLQVLPFRRLLAESMGRILGDRDEKKALDVLDKAEAYLKARGNENARSWYIRWAAPFAITLTAAAFVLWIFRNGIEPKLGMNTFEITIGTLIGSLGALLSILSRSESLSIDPTAGAFIHYIEGVSRIVVGSAGALLVALAVKSNVFLGVIKSSEHSFAALLVIC